jgi:hypothetical protein
MILHSIGRPVNDSGRVLRVAERARCHLDMEFVLKRVWLE